MYFYDGVRVNVDAQMHDSMYGGMTNQFDRALHMTYAGRPAVVALPMASPRVPHVHHWSAATYPSLKVTTPIQSQHPSWTFNGWPCLRTKPVQVASPRTGHLVSHNLWTSTKDCKPWHQDKSQGSLHPKTISSSHMLDRPTADMQDPPLFKHFLVWPGNRLSPSMTTN